jgi:peptidoglycan-N-acetylglucosamine deacetylase
MQAEVNLISQIRNNARNSESVSSPERRLATYPHRPHPQFTPPLLDILEKYRAHETFFMLGEAAHQYPELVRRVAQAGHTIGNHPWDHSSVPFISRHARLEQIEACEQAISPRGQRLFPPPVR